MQGAHEDRGPVEGDAHCDQALAEFAENVLRQSDGTGAVDHPIDNRPGFLFAVGLAGAGHGRMIRSWNRNREPGKSGSVYCPSRRQLAISPPTASIRTSAAGSNGASRAPVTM